MKYEIKENTLIINGVENFDLSKCCSCGQAFRWKLFKDGESWLGIIRGRPVLARQTGDSMTVFPCSEDEAELFINYFDLERDYAKIEKLIVSDSRLSVCLPSASGIRVFNQEPFEALITFIISANNNIKRIAVIVDRLCTLCGDEINFMGEKLYAFPRPAQIAGLTLEELNAIGAGFRAKYILDTSKCIAAGYDLEKLRSMSLDDARKELLNFRGVGPKVADCVLLFSLGHTDAFPIDVWIGRAMQEMFFDSNPPKKEELQAAVESLGKYSGIVQQYIFYYAREIKLGKPEHKSVHKSANKSVHKKGN